MAKLIGNKIILTNEETQLLTGMNEIELVPNQKGIFLLIEKNIAVQNEGSQVCVEMPLIKEQEEVIEIIKKGKLNELVEGKLENTLNDKQKKALIELKTKGQIIVFKLNENYKKGVYKLNEAFEIEKKETKSKKIKDSENYKAEKKALPDYELYLDGFVATTNTERARILSNEYREQIENGELRGIRNFEGIYYLIETNLLAKYTELVIKLMKEQNNKDVNELAKEINASEELTKIVCEFLKEDGELIEKTKGKYQYIE